MRISNGREQPLAGSTPSYWFWLTEPLKNATSVSPGARMLK
jgi:hypothetical protein